MNIVGVFAGKLMPSLEANFVVLPSSVVDPLHFGTDPDPGTDPRILTTDLRIRISDPAFFVTCWQDANKKKVFFQSYFC